jgi:hypothetical protein
VRRLKNFGIGAGIAPPLGGQPRRVMTIKRNLTRALLACLLVLTLLSVAQTSHAEPLTTVNVQGSGSFHLPSPCNCHVGIILEAQASGDAASLHGTGVNRATTGSVNRWEFSGSASGTGVEFSGVVVASTAWYLVGSRGIVTADEATGEITFTLGPLAGGPFQGMIFQIPLSGTVRVNNP